jgi:hypothetical protein
MCGSEGHDSSRAAKPAWGLRASAPMVPPCRSRKSSEFQRVKAGLARAIRSGNKRNRGTVQRDDWLDEGTCFRCRWQENLFQPLSFESQPRPGRLGHLLSDLEPLSSDLQRYSNTDRWQTRRRPALSEKTRVDHPFSYLAKGTSTPSCRVSWNLTVNVRRSRGRRNIVGPAFLR